MYLVSTRVQTKRIKIGFIFLEWIGNKTDLERKKPKEYFERKVKKLKQVKEYFETSSIKEPDSVRQVNIDFLEW